MLISCKSLNITKYYFTNQRHSFSRQFGCRTFNTYTVSSVRFVLILYAQSVLSDIKGKFSKWRYFLIYFQLIHLQVCHQKLEPKKQRKPWPRLKSHGPVGTRKRKGEERNPLPFTSTKSWDKFIPTLVFLARPCQSYTVSSTTTSKESLPRLPVLPTTTRGPPSPSGRYRQPSDFCYRRVGQARCRGTKAVTKYTSSK